MTIILSILGIHLVNTFFVFFALARIVAKYGIKPAYNIHTLLWLFCHPIRNCLVLMIIFLNGEEGLVKIEEIKIEEKSA